jgi:DNA-directed RNA polymerase specialized sigma24 family protein
LRPPAPIGNPEGWLFRIAHNTALDFLRRRNRQEALRSGEEVDMIADQPMRWVAARSPALLAHLHAPAGGAALQRDPDGRARLLAAGSLRGDGFQPAAVKAALHHQDRLLSRTFSGPTAVIGNDMRNSFELALDHLGRKMGGKPVEVIYEDDQQKPDVGKQKTES